MNGHEWALWDCPGLTMWYCVSQGVAIFVVTTTLHSMNCDDDDAIS